MRLLPFSGAIPSVRVSNNSIVNNLAGGLINNSITSGVNVAFSSKSGSTLNELVSGVFSPGILTTAGQGVSQYLTNQIVNSKALGPFGPLVAEFTNSLIQNTSQDLLAGFSGFGSQSGASKWFPGAGNEPPADYSESPPSGLTGRGFTQTTSRSPVYSDGVQGSPDLVFKIKVASNEASQQAQADVNLNGFPPGTPTSVASGEIPNPGSSSSEAPPPELIPPTGPPKISRVGEGSQEDEQRVWKFICSPRDVSWDTSISVNRVEIFGNNTPPVTVGSRGMRELTLSNSIVEGFSRGVTVERKIIDLENLTKFTLNNGKFSVPVFHVLAGNKKYGEGEGEGGFFVIKDIKVKEEMRDRKGNTTRAIVDISFSQVPSYQVVDRKSVV
jgi:hypothetical protein